MYPGPSVSSHILFSIHLIHLQPTKLFKSKIICNKFVFFFLVLLVSGYFLQTLFQPSQHSFQGCMQAILLDDQPADLHEVEKGTMGAFENVSLDMCAIMDR